MGIPEKVISYLHPKGQVSPERRRKVRLGTAFKEKRQPRFSVWYIVYVLGGVRQVH